MKIKVPLELKPNFLRDPENFIRDIACISTQSTRPFFKLRGKISDVEAKHTRVNVFNDTTMEFDEEWKRPDGDLNNRYMHIDLGLTKDAVGIAMCNAPYFVDREIIDIEKGGTQKIRVQLPFVHFDFLGRIKANKGEEILFASIREIIYEITRRGFYIALLTYDGFQSVDSIQILKSQGYKVARLSIDRTATKVILDKNVKDGSGLKKSSTEGQVLASMQSLKDILYDNRMSIPYHPFWKKEAEGAEIDYRKQKVDHKPRGTLDLVQAMAGATYNLVNNETYYEEESPEEAAKTEDKFEDHLPQEDDDYMYESREEEKWEKRSTGF